MMQLIEIFYQQHPILAGLFGGLFIWGCTAFGASFVFFFNTTNKTLMNAFLGAASGIMIAASFWSLLNPAQDIASKFTAYPYIPMVTGFLAGASFIWFIDRFVPHIHLGESSPEGVGSDSMRRSSLLLIAITIHNFPEGLAVGIGFGSVSQDSISLVAAVMLMVGIGIQDIPEGAAISIPLRQMGMSRLKSFMYGQLSGLIEPVGVLIGVILTFWVEQIIPYALSFAAGAMMYVVLEELIPSSNNGTHSDYTTFGAIIGFALMMFLDVSLG